MFMLNALRLRAARRQVAERLCAEVSNRARATIFFSGFGVPDTIDGRFDLVALHAWLVLDALGAQGERELARRFIDTLFVQFDEALRDMGAGDVGMARRIKKMASAFYGRLNAYRAASDETTLADAIARNVFRGNPAGLEPAHAVANYCFAARARVAQSPLASGEVDFGPLPGTP